ncbi:hypothetical protein Lqui_1583 [Legionella quinlivanii]|uniref:Uncharacterized protein n=1 Tax=Legionella quinlivanii TaxID=45073 RepID=A0A0W0Y0T0_9GAMM|nr:hypothetical protein [Legionella quinlivanii]KTD50258.1 hypothetical protein Lqui_1583 [Legionella quinlivanii]MCW8449998.1 hypothetical protein [Legionella quinlivanii]SEF45636.1 hypothetical protein SAMN02746093_00248 [Legionella quinlivanii DSM 21216]STY11857.1 Uncharacterised protein [Legionella quinlivanii]
MKTLISTMIIAFWFSIFACTTTETTRREMSRVGQESSKNIKDEEHVHSVQAAVGDDLRQK